MKRVIALLLVTAVILGVAPVFNVTSVFATEQTGTTDYASLWDWKAYGEGVEMTAYKGDQTDVYVPSTVEKDGVKYSVIKLGDNLFKDKAYLNSVTLGDGITEIGANAFEGATNLVCIVTSESLTAIGANAFSGCTAFNSIILYDEVTSIGENAFLNCPNVTIYCNENTIAHTYVLENRIEYTILNPDATPEIYTQDGIEYYIMNGEAIAISADSTLTEVIIPSVIEGYPVTELRGIFYTNSSYSKNTKLKRCVIPNTVKDIGSNTFYQCIYLESIIIPDGVTDIGNYTFYGCNALTSLTMSDSVLRIGKGAFIGCSFTNITLSRNITEISDSLFQSCSALMEITIPNGVTTIGESGFEDCSRLKSIDIPNSVTTIKESAFSRCRSLESINLPNSITKLSHRVLSGCTSLVSVNIPDTCTEISSYAFYGCKSLIEIKFPETIVSIGLQAFYGCESLSKIELSGMIENIGNKAFFECKNLIKIELPEAVKSIGTNAFPEYTVLCVYENSYGYTYAVNNDYLYFLCEEGKEPEFYTENGITYYIMNGNAVAISADDSLTEVVIPDKISGYPVTETRYTFRGNTNLTSITLPETLKIIGKYTFNGCKGLTSITIPDSVTQIGVNVFSSSGLVSIAIPKSVENIGTSAFSYCYSLESVNIEDGANSIGDSAFSNCNKLQNVVLSDHTESIGKEAFLRCTSLSKITIPGSVISIGESAFEYCTALAEVTINNGVVSIGKSAFEDCLLLTEIIIPDSVTSIGSYAFMRCKSLQNVKLSNSLKNISTYAFGVCEALENVIIPDGVTGIDYYAFSACINLSYIIIPESVAYIRDDAFPESVILGVKENSYAYTYAIENDSFFYIAKDNEEPEIYVVDGIKYFIKDNNAIAIDYDGSATEIIIPEKVEGYPVTELKETFRGLTEIKSVVIPDTVKCIGTNTFYECTGLIDVTLPTGLEIIERAAFFRCYSLESVSFPDSIKSIGFCAFQSSGLKEVSIPENVTNIEGYAFANCESLEKANIPGGVQVISATFDGCIELKEVVVSYGVTEIGKAAFNGCKELTEVIIPDTVTTIGENAFYNCAKLENVTIPGGAASVGKQAFLNTGLTQLVIPESVKSMGSSIINTNKIYIVYEDSYAHSYVQNLSDCLYFVLRKTENPEIAYGSGISGTATYTDGTVAVNASVEMLYDDGVVKETVTTDENGAYNFTYAEVGRYTIRVTDDSGNTGSETVSVKRMNVFDVFLSGETDVVLKKGYTISGTVSPTGDTTVTLTDIDGNIVATDETTDGTFTFENIPNGTYILKAETETGMTAKEITVFNSDILNEILIIEENSAVVTGYVEVEDREFKHHRRNWVDVTIYNSEGVAIASQKTDKDGKYTFRNISIGEYSIVAETAEMRPDKHKHFERSHQLTGYAYVNVTEATTYEVDTIILYEENDNLATISGKVTAQGETQDCEVILRNVFRHEVAKLNTGKNGKYIFKNVKDGLYFITAITESDGMGFAVVVVRNGKFYGETDIFVRKSDRVHEHERYMKENIPECNSKEEARQHRDKIAKEKRFYDSLPEKEKKQFSKEYIERLNRLSELIADCEYNKPDDVEITNGGTIISGDELEEDDVKVKLVLNVIETSPREITEDGIKTDEQFIQQSIEDAAKGREIVKYYDISLSKNEKEISHIHKHTDTTGKLRITMEIPEEHRGHKNYTFVHMHNGEPTTLVDLDNDPNTVTFEIDRFSTFALTYSDVELTSADDESATIVYDEISGKIKVSSLQNSKLFIATYNGNEVIGADIYDVTAGTTEAEYAFNENQAAFIWDENMNYLCEKFTIGE